MASIRAGRVSPGDAPIRDAPIRDAPAETLSLPLRHAVLLGLIHGPTELLPVSSSAHTALIPRLLGWPSAELDPEDAKTLEVALHCGAALGLLIALRRELWGAVRQPGLLALALAPPAAVGYAFERPIQRRLGGPRSIAFGLGGGGIAMGIADLLGGRTRRAENATTRDGVLLGVAQALALVPGVSRNGATLTVARALGFARDEAQTLSWRVALPVILGATSLKGRRLLQRGRKGGDRVGRDRDQMGGNRDRVGRDQMGGNRVGGDRDQTGGDRVGGDPIPALAVGAGAAFLSTLASSPLIAPGRRGRPLLPFALYRLLLAAIAVSDSKLTG